MRGNFGLFYIFSPKLPRIHVGLRCNSNRKINREKGYLNSSSKDLFSQLVAIFVVVVVSSMNLIRFYSQHTWQRREVQWDYTLIILVLTTLMVNNEGNKTGLSEVKQYFKFQRQRARKLQFKIKWSHILLEGRITWGKNIANIKRRVVIECLTKHCFTMFVQTLQ